MRKLSMWVLVAAACAARQQTGSVAPPGWNAERIGEIRGRCIAGSTDRGVEARSARAMCNCMVPQFTERFSYEWLDDGHPVTTDEARAIGTMQDRCARQLADSGVSKSASEEEGTGSGGL